MDLLFRFCKIGLRHLLYFLLAEKWFVRLFCCNTFLDLYLLFSDLILSGLFGTLGFGKKSKYSIEFRLCTKVIAAYILHQVIVLLLYTP